MDKINKLKPFLKEDFVGDVFYQLPMALYTWYKIGGPAAVFCSPESEDSLIELIKHCHNENIDYFILGDGANLLVSDAGYDGVIISLKEHLNKCFIRNEYLFAQAGAYLNDIILLAQENNLAGLEYLSGIPGTVGGALFMNAGIDSGNIGDVVTKVMVLNKNYEVEDIKAKAINFNYRNVPELKDKIILASMLKLRVGKEAELKKIRQEILEIRARKQPLEYPSCGSVFKRPKGFYVGKLVQDLGLKGFRHGDAMISEKHAGFIVNMGNATAADVLFIINKIKEDVFKEYKVILKPEVKLLGF